MKTHLIDNGLGHDYPACIQRARNWRGKLIPWQGDVDAEKVTCKRCIKIMAGRVSQALEEDDSWSSPWMRATGFDLDKLASNWGISRLLDETDKHLRARLKEELRI